MHMSRSIVVPAPLYHHYFYNPKVFTQKKNIGRLQGYKMEYIRFSTITEECAGHTTKMRLTLVVAIAQEES
jgi:hypothetical protein